MLKVTEAKRFQEHLAQNVQKRESENQLITLVLFPVTSYFLSFSICNRSLKVFTSADLDAIFSFTISVTQLRYFSVRFEKLSFNFDPQKQHDGNNVFIT